MLAVVAWAAMPGVAQAQNPVEFRTINIVVGSTAGGGYDTYARVLARHISRYIPGQPNIVVQNMPGASSLKAVKYLDTGPPTDGSVITAFNPGLLNEFFSAPTRSASSSPASPSSAASPAICAPATRGAPPASKPSTI